MAGVHRGGGGKGHQSHGSHGPPPAPAGHGSGSVAFFAALPQDELTPLETGLRQVLLDWLVSLQHQPFPLTEWIDRRIGGEIETRRDDQGHTHVFFRGGQAPPPGHGGAHFAPPPGNFARPPAPGMGFHPPPAYGHPPMPPPVAGTVPPPLPPGAKGAAKGGSEAFFRSLPGDSFPRPELDLRDAIFDFLASWTSQALANLEDLGQSAAIKKCAAAFLPKEVMLGEWIEKRIGQEIQLKQEAGSRVPIIHLSKAAQSIVADKYKQMEASGGRGGGGGGGGSQHQPRPKGEAKPVGQQVDNRSPEEFFKSLPGDELLDKELALREAVLQFIDRWAQRKGDTIPTLSDLGQDPVVVKARQGFLPQKVGLRDWVDRRIGGEVVVAAAPRGGGFEVYLRDSKHHRSRGDQGSRGGGDREKGNGKSSAESPDAFFARLPDDSLTDPETDTRQAVLDFLDRKHGPVSLQEAMKDPSVHRGASSLLPPEVNLRQWIDRRIGGEVTIEKDNKSGQWMMRKAGSDSMQGHGGGHGSDAKKEEFFASLPDDSFTNEENDLRDTLLAFLGQWTGSDSPSLSDAAQDPEVRRARPAALPKSSQVSLKDWVERRIGGEIEVAPDPRGQGQWLFNLRGSLVVPERGGQGMGGNKKRRMH